MKRSMGIFWAMVMILSSVFVLAPVEVEAATTYNFLWPVENGNVSQYFKANGVHEGIDIVSSGNDTIYAACSGKVIRAHNPCTHINDYNLTECTHYSTYGNSIAVQHDDGTIAYYGHLKYNSLKVKVNDRVEAGQAIAQMGSSGMSTGKHLHFDLRYSSGTKINVNPISNGGLINYRHYGYEGQIEIIPATITEGKYFLNNGGYRVYMKEDKEGSGSIAASNGSTNDNFEIAVEKDGSYYLMYPTATAKSYVLNCYWGKGGTETANGNEITLWKDPGDVLSKRWIFEECGEGYLIHPVDKMSLSITREGNILYVKTTTKAANQIWTLEDACNHTYEITYDKTNDKTQVDWHWQECTKCGDKKDYEEHQLQLLPAYNETHHFYVCIVCDRQSASEHGYAHSCDSECIYCGAIRDRSHLYTDDCDSVCNGCETAREAPHYYVNDCDSVCDKCGVTREISHTYDNICDTTCDICGEIRQASHIYTDGCDGDCNLCGLERYVIHNFGEWTEISAPTCTASGVKQRACNNCDYYETETLVMIDHKDENSDAVCDMCEKSVNSDDVGGENNGGNNNNAAPGCGGVIEVPLFAVIMFVGTGVVSLAKKKED